MSAKPEVLGMNKSETPPNENIGYLTDHFKTSFSTMGKNIAVKLTPSSIPYDDFLPHQNNLRFQLTHSSTMDVINAIESLNDYIKAVQVS